MMDLLRNIDHALFHFINGVAVAEWLDPVMILLSSKWVWWPCYLLFTALFVYKYRKLSWIVILLAIIVVGITDSLSSKVVKPGVKRVRPNHAMEVRMPEPNDGHSRYGFVSSHASNAFAIFFFAALFLRLRLRHTLLLLLVPAIIAYSRVYLGVHYPADIAGGGLIGMAVAWLAWVGYGKCLQWWSQSAQASA